MVGKTGETVEWMFSIVEGRVDYYQDVRGRLFFYQHFSNDVDSGGVSGLLPYSRMKIYSGNAICVGMLHGVRLHKKYFQEL